MTKIFIVEDSPLIMSVLVSVFTEKGFEVTSSGSAEECLGKVASVDPDIILSDIQMPGMDGFVLCEKLRKEHKFKKLIVLMTANMSCVDAVKAFDMGADDFCVKTSDMEHVIKIVTKTLSGEDE